MVVVAAVEPKIDFDCVLCPNKPVDVVAAGVVVAVPPNRSGRLAVVCAVEPPKRLVEPPKPVLAG